MEVAIVLLNHKIVDVFAKPTVPVNDIVNMNKMQCNW